MFDRRKPSDEGSSAPPQGADKKDPEDYIQLESSSSGAEPAGRCVPPGSYRQGYCSCCQVHYVNLETHLTSIQHRQMSTCHRNRFSNSVIMERFLTDVHLYHPLKYHDTRPTYDDIPDVIKISPSPENGSLVLLSTDTQEKDDIGASRTIPDVDNLYTSEPCIVSPCKIKNNSNKITLAPPCTENLKKGQCFTGVQPLQNNIPPESILITSQNALYTAVGTIPHSSASRNLCSTSPFIAKNCSCPAISQPLLYIESSKNMVGERNKYGSSAKCPDSEMTISPNKGLLNRPLDSQGSCFNLTSGISCGKQIGLKSQGETDNVLRTQMFSSHLQKTGVSLQRDHISQLQDKGIRLFERDNTSVDEIIEEVIRKYCYGIVHRKSPEMDEESASSVKVQSVIGCTEGSTLSFDWEMPMELVNDQPKTLFKNLDLLKETTVNLGEDYTSKLSSILCAYPVINEERNIKVEEKNLKVESEAEILKALPHIPPSFVGKTWSQVMYEDDLKIEALVQEFKKGKFHCYFENGSAKSGRRRRRLKSEQFEKKVEPQKEVWKETEIADELPSFLEGGHDSDIPSVISDKVIKPEIVKPARRTWRLASRCQIVKVSHGTQTSLHSYQLPKRNAIKDEHQPESRQDLPYEFEDEKTPDMKTGMCSLRLPESYTKILTPVQPKTVVYVLSHPDAKQRKNKPACISKQGRNQYSTESKDSVYYKYKQSPLKYYDPLTNRILKTPPRNAVRATSVKGPCVRKLFRSLSSDVNVHKLDLEQKESTASKKSLSSCSFTSLYVDSLKGSDVSPSIQGSGSSSSTGCLKSRCSDKPYRHLSISPCNTRKSPENNDIPLTPIITRARNRILGSKKNLLLQKKNVRASRMKQKPVKDLKNKTNSISNQHRMVRMLKRSNQSSMRQQSTRKSSITVGKSIVPFLKAYRPRQKAVNKSLKNNFTVREDVQTILKSEFISLKPTKGKPKMAKPVEKDIGQRKSRDRTCKTTSDRNIRITRSMEYTLRNSSDPISRTTRSTESSTKTHRIPTSRRRVR